MQPDVFQLIGYGSLALLVIYVIFQIRRTRAAPKAGEAPHELRDAHMQALRENSELLRELIAINRKLLEKQELQDG